MRRLLITALVLIGGISISSAIEQPDSVKSAEEPDTLKTTVNLNELEVKHDNVERRGNQDRITVTKKMREGIRVTGQLLGNLQGFTSSFDGRELSYMGSSNIIILVDSLQRDQDYVKRLNPGRFQSIDVVYRPIGRYADYDVLINLRTKPHYIGTEVTANAFANFAPEQKLSGGLTNSYANIDITHTRDKTNFYATGGTNYYAGTSNKVTTISYPINSYKEETYGTDKDPSHSMLNRQAWGLGAFDWQINTANTLSLAYKFYTRDNNDHNRGTLIAGSNPPATYDEHSRKWDVAQNSVGLDYNGSVIGWYIGASLYGTIERYKSSMVNKRSTGFMLSDKRQYKDANIGWNSYFSKMIAAQRGMVSINYMGNWQNMTADALSTGTRLSSLVSRRNRLLTGVQYFFSNKLTMLAAAGADFTDIRSGEESDRRLAPSGMLSASLTFNRTTWLRMRYETELTSPSATSLLDYGQFTDSLIWTGGNPALRSGLTHNIDVVFGLLNCITLKAQAGICPDQVEYVYDATTGMRPDGTTGPYVTYIPRNVNYRRFNFIASYNKDFGLWNINSSLQWMMLRYKCSDFTTSMNMALPALNVKLTRNVPSAGFRAVIAYTAAKSPSIGIQETGWYKFDYFKISMSKTFLRNKALSASLEYIPPVHLFTNSRIETLTSPGYVKHTVTTSDRYVNNNRVYFNLSYRFSNGKQVRRYQRSLSGN